MSINQLASQIAKLRAQAAEVQEQWARTLKEVGHDPNLSDEGKRAALNKEFADAREYIVSLRVKESDLVRIKKESLERSLFGLSGTSDANKIIAYRDAQDRAGRATSQSDALALYDSAKRSNDDSLAKAILAKAVEFNYREIVDDYTLRNPVWREELSDLASVRHYGENTMQHSLAYALFRGPESGDTSGFVSLNGAL